MNLCRKLFLLTGFILAFSACKDNNTNQTAQTTPQNVSVIELSPQNIPLSFEFSARAQGSKETEVRARVSGILLKRNYVEGSKVEEGSVLFEIDPDQYKVALDQAKAQLAQAKAQFINAETQWKRTDELHKQGFASDKALDEARATMDSLAASKELAQAAVEAAQLNFDYTTVKAPISGITSMEAQSEGSLISTTGLLTKIVQVDPIYVIFSASENEIMSLRDMTERGLIRNPENKAEIVAKVRFGDDTMYNQNGTINFINPTIDESTGTIKLRAVFPNEEGKVRPGQFLRLVMEGLTRIDALTVPQEAVMQEANGSYVYRVGENNVLESVSVKTGLTTPNGEWIIDEGLKAGDKVVVAGLLKLRPGMNVNPVVAEK
ncbi:MAG: efflux RND transporter periplasmic adaptor subunit [Alphaproteobacteria bacterium]|nr:efflux RND transporter periplasmic adaptor subunit [Alphaproteobacteria bacterium]